MVASSGCFQAVVGLWPLVVLHYDEIYVGIEYLFNAKLYDLPRMFIAFPAWSPVSRHQARQLSADFFDISWFFIRGTSLSGYSNLIRSIVPIGKLSESSIVDRMWGRKSWRNFTSHIPSAGDMGSLDWRLKLIAPFFAMHREFLIIGNVNISSGNISIWYL